MHPHPHPHPPPDNFDDNNDDGAFLFQDWDLGEVRCSCGFPESNLECESLLVGNNPTEAPSELQDSVVEGGVGGEGTGDEGTPTWVIVTAIAMVSVCCLCLYTPCVF